MVKTMSQLACELHMDEELYGLFNEDILYIIYTLLNHAVFHHQASIVMFLHGSGPVMNH